MIWKSGFYLSKDAILRSGWSEIPLCNYQTSFLGGAHEMGGKGKMTLITLKTSQHAIMTIVLQVKSSQYWLQRKQFSLGASSMWKGLCLSDYFKSLLILYIVPLLMSLMHFVTGTQWIYDHEGYSMNFSQISYVIRNRMYEIYIFTDIV